MNLNEQQKEAVNSIEAPCLVLAGAGSGKTRVITEKIVHLISDCSYSARSICAVTFTNKAAKEMKERVSALLLPQYVRGLRICTFHALGLEIIYKEHVSLGLSNNFSLFDENDSLGVMKDIIDRMFANKIEKDDLKEKAYYWLKEISYFKNKLLSFEDVKKIGGEQNFIASEIYKEYSKSMQSFNAVDFDDLIYLVVKLFQINPSVLERWRNRIRYLLVDEYQDTNTSQYELVKLLVYLHHHFTVVGDDDQSIYSWRGAVPQNIPNLVKDFPDLRIIKLEQNYRSRGRILKCANALIANNKHEYTKKLFSNLEFGEKIKVIEVPSADEEGNKLVAEIMAHRYLNHTHYKDYAVLYRGNYESRDIQKVMQKSHIPFRVVGGQNFFEQSEVKDFMCYLRIIANNDDNKAFLRIVNIPRREIGTVSIEHLTNFANKHGLSLLESCSDARLQNELTKKECEKFINFVNFIYELRFLINGKDAIESLRKLPELSGYTEWLRIDSGSDKAAEVRLDNVNTLVDWVVAGMSGEKDSSDELLTFNEAVNKISIREMLDRNEQDNDLDEVQLMTLHSSKGLEFPYVYIIDMEESILPHKASIDAGMVEEERRLAYVGITRARFGLTFMYCHERKARDKREKIRPDPSRFLMELPQEDLNWDKGNFKSKSEGYSPEERNKIINGMYNDIMKMFKDGKSK